MTRRTADEGRIIDLKLIQQLSDKYDPLDGFTGNHLTKMILGSDKHTDVQYIERRIAGLRYVELVKIRESNGSYKPEMFLAAKKINQKFWRYFNACEEPHFSDIMKIYYQRAEGLEQVAKTMELLT